MKRILRISFGPFDIFWIDLSRSSLSLSLSYTEYYWSILELEEARQLKDKKSKGRKISSKEEQDQAITMGLLAGVNLNV